MEWAKLGCAMEKPCRQDVSRFKILLNAAENGLQVRKDCPGELIDEESSLRPQQLMGVGEDPLSHGSRHTGVRDSRDHVVRSLQLQFAQDRTHIACRSAHYSKPRVRTLPLYEL